VTSRERVRTALDHREPDRVPIDVGGTTVTGIHVDEYVEIGKHLGWDLGPPKVYEQFQMLARIDGLMMQWLRADVVQLENVVETWNLANADWKAWTTSLGNPVLVPGRFDPRRDDQGNLRLVDAAGKSIAVMAPTGLYFDRDCPTAMSTADTVHMAPETWKKANPLYTDEELRALERRGRFLFENTEYSVHGGFGKGGLGTNGLFAGHTITDWLCILVTERAYAREILQATAERAVENLELYLQAVGAYIDTILVSGTDFGSQRGELFNPEIFRELHLPSYRLINDAVHRHGAVKTMFHSCGSIGNLIGSFIEAGVDILNPVHTNSLNMEPQRLKQAFGGRIVFWGGGIETQTVLPNGSVEEVAAQVRERMLIFGRGGGFVFAPVHNIQYGVPPRNVEAMVWAAVRYGRYPLER
jgi:uroporphyrinogen decarboxylase